VTWGKREGESYFHLTSRQTGSQSSPANCCRLGEKKEIGSPKSILLFWGENAQYAAAPTTASSLSSGLDLETPGPSATTSTLELAALAANVGLLVAVRTKAKVLNSLTGVLGTTEKEGVGAGGGPLGKLVEGQALTTSLDDPGTGGSGESKSGNRELGDSEHPVVVSDGADKDNSLGLVALGLGSDPAEGHRGPVDPRHEEPAEDGLVESGVGPTSQEPVKLDEELNVGVLALGSGTVRVSHVVGFEIDT